MRNYGFFLLTKMERVFVSLQVTCRILWRGINTTTTTTRSVVIFKFTHWLVIFCVTNTTVVTCVFSLTGGRTI